MNKTEEVSILRVTEEGTGDTRGALANEFAVTIILNNEELVTLLCSPSDLDCLAIGFLCSEGLVNTRDEIKKTLVDQQRGVVRVEIKRDNELARELPFKRLITSGCGRGASLYSAADIPVQKVESQAVISVDEVFALVDAFQHASEVYLATHGVHSAALCDTKGILVFAEDIGRHNAIDKIFGKCLLENMPTHDQVVVTSGRISSEILYKVAKRGIPILTSISVPTCLGVNIANDLGITLIGSVKVRRRMNVYSHAWRVVSKRQ